MRKLVAKLFDVSYPSAARITIDSRSVTSPALRSGGKWSRTTTSTAFWQPGLDL
jgi:hypothetical protein